MKNNQLLLTILTLALISFPSYYLSNDIDSNGIEANNLLINKNIQPTAEEKTQEITIEDYEDVKYSFDSESKINGVQKFAVVCVNFPDNTVTRFTKAEVEEMMGVINDFWVNVSRGAISIDYQVEGWIELTFDEEWYGDLFKKFRYVAKEAVEKSRDLINYYEYDHLLVLVNQRFRCVSTIGKNFAIQPLSYMPQYYHAISASLVSEFDGDPYQKVWGVICHEMAHSMGLIHTHGSGTDGQKNYESMYDLMAAAYPASLTTYTMSRDSLANWYDQDENEVVLKGGDVDTVTVYPRYLDTTGIIQTIKIEITSSLYYRVEVIRKKGEDAWVSQEGVFIYLVDRSQHKEDECTDMDSTPDSATGHADLVDCLWQLGDTFHDDFYEITIEIEGIDGENYEIFVENMHNTIVDLMIHEWGSPEGVTPPYETTDIWIDSLMNGWDNYRYADESGNPVGSGDAPWVNTENIFYAKIHNIGNGDASNVEVYFLENYPLGAGGDNEWKLIDKITIDVVPKESSVIVGVPWTPEVELSGDESGVFDYHSCVKVQIKPHDQEVSPGNNIAQENICHFEVFGTGTSASQRALPSSFFESITTTIKISNPFSEERLLYVSVIDDDDNWNVTGEGLREFHNFTANEIKEFEITVIPSDEIRFTDKIAPSIFVAGLDQNVTASDFDRHLTILGGMTIEFTAMYRTEIEVSAEIRIAGSIDIFGTIAFIDEVPVEDQPSTVQKQIMIEIMNNQNLTIEYFLQPFDEQGDFDFRFEAPEQGNYTITAFFAGTNVLTSSKSITLIVNSETGIVSSTTSSGLFSGFSFLITINVIIANLILIKKKKKG